MRFNSRQGSGFNSRPGQVNVSVSGLGVFVNVAVNNACHLMLDTQILVGSYEYLLFKISDCLLVLVTVRIENSLLCVY